MFSDARGRMDLVATYAALANSILLGYLASIQLDRSRSED
jgi:hypothetical protein